MQHYLLFIDTETTGLPLRWNAPYADGHKWPSALQISWMIYDKEGNELKRESYYVSDNQIDIEPKAAQIHRLNPLFLRNHGRSRLWVMRKLARDLTIYEPLVIGHFVELDYHILSADFYRCAIPNPLKELSLFCTMLASTKYIKEPWMKHLRLAELYTELFDQKLEGGHNAAIDVAATARIFFEMKRRQDITDGSILKQQQQLAKRMWFLQYEQRLKRWGLVLIFLLVISLVIGLLIMG